MARADIQWIRSDSARERARLDAWRLGVGAELFVGPTESARSAGVEDFADLAVVVWNTHVGAGDLESFVSDLEGGLLTEGVPVEHFVLLVQEAHRGGGSVPSRLGAARAAARIHGVPPTGVRGDLARFARVRGLHLLYVPSMRNGSATPEDRGNAILSTLPLSRPRAFELPFERQRRVAIGARVTLPPLETASPTYLDFVNLHLDPRSAALRAHRSFGAGRDRQVAWLLDALDRETDTDHGDVPLVVAGDFNTWVSGRAEAALARMRTRFVQAGLATTATSLLPSLSLDHVFFELPRGWSPRFSLHHRAYGSDHRPIVGWLGIT